MMAHHSAPGPVYRPLSPETLDVLRSAVVSHWQNADTNDDALRAALARVATEAREKSLRVEEVIVAFKALWSAIPELASTPARSDDAQLRERLVTMCIKAYYGE